jgi:hypothetical protein
MTTITPVGAGAAGRATQITVGAFNQSEALTAVRADSGKLLLIGWQTENGITRRADSGTQAGEAEEIALTLMGRRAVTAVRTGAGRLMLISWNAAPGLGSITRLRDSANAAGEATLIASAGLGESMLITACRAGNGRLLLISWRLNADGSFTRLADSGSQAGEVSVVALTTIGGLAGTAVTAVRTASGTLKLIGWAVAPDGRIQRRGEAEAGRVGEIEMVRRNSADGNSGVLTAVQAEDGHLLVIAWHVGADGSILRQGDTANAAGQASRLSIATAAGLSTSYVASMRNGSGDLQLIAFEVDRAGRVRRTGDHRTPGQPVTETNIAGLPDGRVLTATRLRNTLHLNTWTVVAALPTSPGVEEALEGTDRG